MQISKNFNLDELIKSETANKLGIANIPPQSAINNLTMLVINLLQPLRDFIGEPIKINSGYRCLALNRTIGSKDNSQHILGEAVDIIISKKSPKVLFEIIRDNFDFDQLILESSWVHVSYRINNNRKMVIEELKNGK